MIFGKSAVNDFECKFITVLFVILISYAANGKHVKYPNEMIEELSYINTYEIGIDDDKYPSAILEQIVRDTYVLLKSDDEEEKRKLKMDPSDYKDYLCALKMPGSPIIPSRKKCRKSRTMFEEVSRSKIGKHFGEGGCSVKNYLVRPKLQLDVTGTEYYIVNVSPFEQYINVSKCVYSIQSCGDSNRKPDPQLFKSYCEQETVIVKMFGIPVNETLVMENQYKVEVPYKTKCSCKLERIWQSENKIEESRSLKFFHNL